MKQIIGLLFLISTLLAISCGPSGQPATAKNIPLTLSAPGPLYGGPNTATGEWKVDLSSFINPMPKTINKATISALRLQFDSEEDAAMFTNAVVSISAKSLDMEKIAFQPVGKSGQILELQVAADQNNLAKFFKGDVITFVVDFDFAPEEWEEDFTLRMEFDLDLLIEP